MRIFAEHIWQSCLMVTLHLSFLDLTGSSSPTLHSPIHSPLVRHLSLTMSPLESPYPFRPASTPQIHSPTGSSVLIDECSMRIHHRNTSLSLLSTSFSIGGQNLGSSRDRPSDIDGDADIETLAPLKLATPSFSTNLSSRLACDELDRGVLDQGDLEAVDLPQMDLVSNVALHFPHFFARPTRDKVIISELSPTDICEDSALLTLPSELEMSGGPRLKKTHSLCDSKTLHRHLKLVRRAQPQRLALVNPDKPLHLKSEVATRFPAHDHDHAMKSLLEQNRLITQMNHRWNNTMNGFSPSTSGGILKEEILRSHKRARSDSADSRTDTDDQEQYTCPPKDAN